MKDTITKNQHYIPQVYLRGFSPEYQKSPKKYLIYETDIKTNKYINNYVPVDSICFEQNLYEVTGKNGQYVLPNYLEKALGGIESGFSIYRSQLETKCFNEENFYRKSFLSSEEKAFWIAYIAVQVLRHPESLKIVEKLASDLLSEKMTSNQIKNFATISCLPFFQPIEVDSLEAIILNSLIEPMLNMYFQIIADKEGRFITSDKPISILPQNYPCKEYDRIIFPVSAHICLILNGNEYKENTSYKNTLFPYTEERRKNVFRIMVDNAYKDIYMNHKLDSKEKEWLKESKQEVLALNK